MEDKNVQKLLDMLYGMIDEARGATFSSEKCIINREEALDLLDEVRTKLPAELSKAQDLMKSKEQYVDKANREVKRMLDQAQDEAKRLRDQAQEESRRMLEKAQEDAKTIVSESETIQRAQRRSSEIIHQAEDRSRQLYQVANTYTEDALRRTEEAIQAARAAYDALSDQRKAQVSNYDVLLAAEKKLAQLQDEAVAHVEELIDAIGQPVIPASRAAVEAARAAYNALGQKLQERVGNYDVLLAAEARLAELNAQDIYKTTGDFIVSKGAPVTGSIGGEWAVLGLAPVRTRITPP